MAITSTDLHLRPYGKPDPGQKPEPDGKKPKRVSVPWLIAGITVAAAIVLLLWPTSSQATESTSTAPGPTPLAPDTTFFVQPELLSRPEGRDQRIERAHRLLGEGLDAYFQSAALVVRQLDAVPGLSERLQTGHLRKLSLSIADLPRKLFAESRFQRDKTDRILRDLGFAPGAGTKVWKAAGDALDEFGAALLDPNVIDNAFESPEAQSRP